MIGALAVGAGGIGAAAMAGLGREIMPAMDSASGSWWLGSPVALGSAAMSAWSERIGSEFKLEGAGGGASFKLAEVRPLSSPGVRPGNVARKRGFLVVFEGAQQLPGDAIYSARHADGAFDVFVSAAISDDRAAARLHAVFN
jgi:hypothetical protein